ncbi:MAG: hydrogenase maturation protease [Candidatus Lokiarchaeota archaeon]
MEELYNRIFNRLKGCSRVVFLGIGENKLTDDGIGPYIITELLEYTSKKFLFINAGIDPMVRISEITNFKPSHLIILDTCTLQAEPGTIALIDRENISEYVPISSHTIPIHIVIDLIHESLPNLNTFMIGFVPKSLDGFTQLRQYKKGELSLDEINENENLPLFDFQLTEELQKTANNTIKLIKKLIKEV